MSRIWKFLKTYEWPLIWMLAVLAFCLGLIGFRQHFKATRTQLDIIYLALQLFTLESGTPAGQVGIPLNIARFLAPGVTVYAAAKALAVIFQRQLQLVRLKTMRSHVVIAGLGRSGMLFTETFRKKHIPVVVIDRAENSEHIANCQNAGGLIVQGDARYADILLKAGVDRAKVLICVAGEDGTNAEIAAQTRALLKEERQPLTALVHIIDSQLCRLLRRQELMTGNTGRMRMEFFNVYESAVRDLLAQHPPFHNGLPGNILIIGLGQMGESLLLALTRTWMQKMSATRFAVAVLDRAARRKVEALEVRYPYLIKNCAITPLEVEVPSSEFYQKVFLKDSGPSLVYICLDQASLALSTALLLRQWVSAKTPIFVRISHQGGLSALLNQPAGKEADQDRPHLIPFGDAERICTPDLLSGGLKEILARVIHEEYVKDEMRKGATRQTNPALCGWEELQESFKESNRRQADHIGEKLRRIHCDVVLFSDQEAFDFQFEDKEVDALARMEHERWILERTTDGWTYAEGEKNLEKKTNPYLVSYDRLPDHVKESNRNNVRELPRFLARAGYQIYRI